MQNDANVVHLTRVASEPSPNAGAGRLPVILVQVRDKAALQLKQALQALFDNADDTLFEMADRATSNLEQNAFFEAMRDLPEIILEPGRSLIANAGILVSEVVLVARKSRTAVERWVYADVGKFSGLIETMDESIKFPIWTEKQGEMEEVVIAGPTCDSADIMYEHYKYGLPLNLASGDRLYWLSTGAYTTSYSAVEFNGFPPLKAFYL